MRLPAWGLSDARKDRINDCTFGFSEHALTGPVPAPKCANWPEATKPNACHDRAERNTSSYTMRPKSPKIASAQTSTTNLKIGSPISCREVKSNDGGLSGALAHL